MAAEKLIELGCRKLLFLRISADLEGEVEKRYYGFESACRKAAIPYDSVLLRDTDPEELFYRFLEDHVTDGKLEYDGIFCNSDEIAVRVRNYLVSRNVRVPEDVQIIGYDGVKDYATGQFTCSTIVQPVPEMAEAAVKYLLLNQGELTPTNITLPVYYAPGGTTKD